MKKSQLKSLMFFIFLIICAVITSAFAYRKIQKTQSNVKNMKKNKIAVNLYKIRSGSLINSVNAIATVHSSSTIQIKSESSGKIIKLLKKEGDRVKKGEILGHMESVEEDAQLRSAKANIESVTEQLSALKLNINSLVKLNISYKHNRDYLKKEMTRKEKLLKTGGISQSIFEASETKFQEAESRYRSTIEQINSLKKQKDIFKTQIKIKKESALVWKKRCENTIITSPDNGIISSKTQEEGNYISIGTPLYSMEADGSKRLIMDVSQKFVKDIRTGLNVITDINKRDEPQFQVERIYPVIDAYRQFRIEAKSSSNAKKLFYGMQIPVKIVIQEETGQIISSGSIFEDYSDPGNYFVYEIKNAKALKRKITPLLFNESGNVVVKENTFPENTEFVTGTYLSNLRMPSDFSVEVIR